MSSSLEEKTKNYWAISSLVRTHKILNADTISAIETLRDASFNEPRLLARVINLQKGVGLKVA